MGERSAPPPSPRRPSVHDIDTSPGDLALDVEIEVENEIAVDAPLAVPVESAALSASAPPALEPAGAADAPPLDTSPSATDDEATTAPPPNVFLESLASPSPPAPTASLVPPELVPLVVPAEEPARAALPLAAHAEPAPDEAAREDVEAPAAGAAADAVVTEATLVSSSSPEEPTRGAQDFPTPPAPFDALPATERAAAPSAPPLVPSAPALALPVLSVAPPRKRSLPPPPPSARAASAPPPPPVPFALVLPVLPVLVTASTATDSSSIDAGWDEIDGSSDDLTRRLPDVVPSRVESSLSDVDVTSPLPPPAAAPMPYGSDTDLTRPIAPFGAKEDAPVPVPVAALAPPPGRRPVPSIPPLRPVPTIAPAPPPPVEAVPVYVAVPPQSVGVMEHSPSVQISANAGRRSSIPPAPAARRSSVPPPPVSHARGDGHETLPRIPRPAPVPSEFGVRATRSSMVPVAGTVPPPPIGVSRRWMVALAAVTFGVGALALALRPRTGSLIVTVSGVDGAAVRGVSIRVDGVERCAASPCRLGDLSPGAHLVSAAAAGLPASAERAIAVETGEVAAEHVTLTSPRRTELSGLSVAAIGDGLHVVVDGRDLGAPPISLRDVEPGSHTVRVQGTPGLYEPYEETVKLEDGEVRSLGPVRLHLLKGRLQLSAGDGSDGAAIAVDGHRVSALPAVIDLSPDESHEVTATKRGFSDLSEQVVFDGTAERSVVVTLAPTAGAPQYRATAVPHASFAPRPSGAPRNAAFTAATGSATLDLNSVPRANVVLNGRPLGSTPIANVKVSPGPQTIVFVHPTLGRKITSTTVAPGKHAAAFVKF